MISQSKFLEDILTRFHIISQRDDGSCRFNETLVRKNNNKKLTFSYREISNNDLYEFGNIVAYSSFHQTPFILSPLSRDPSELSYTSVYDSKNNTQKPLLEELGKIIRDYPFPVIKSEDLEQLMKNYEVPLSYYANLQGILPTMIQAQEPIVNRIQLPQLYTDSRTQIKE